MSDGFCRSCGIHYNHDWDWMPTWAIQPEVERERIRIQIRECLERLRRVRVEKAETMRENGATYKEIGAALNISAGRAREICVRLRSGRPRKDAA